VRVKVNGVDVFHPNTGEVRSDGPDGIACWFIDTDYNEESFFVRHAYFLGANDPYSALKTTLKAEINAEAWATLNSDTSRPFPKPKSGRIAVKVINHLGDEVMKVFKAATLGTLKEHPRIKRFRDFLKGWYLSYFHPDAARSLPSAGPQKHLNIHGDNIGNVVQFLEREHSDRFRLILNRIASKIPGVKKIDTKVTDDKRVLLRFNDGAFDDPFFAQQMSDGTLKVFAYLLMMEDPDPPPFICIEEPENGLYHKLLESLAREFRSHATGKKGAPQLFVTTHQPYFVDALTPQEVWVLEKGKDGYSSLRRAADIELVQNMVNQGLPLGGLWYSDYLDAR
jgi:hypothetical protein